MRTVAGHPTLAQTPVRTGSIPTGLPEALAVLFVVALAAWLRLWRLDLVEFKNDEAWALRLAEDMVRLGQVPLVGLTTSLGVPNPPHLIYFLAPIVALTRDPRAAAAAVALANVAGVAGVVLLGWRIMSPLGGLVAGLARLLNHVAIQYEPAYGAPLAQSEAVAQELVAFASQTGSQHLLVETWPDSEPIAYLARPFFPSLELVDRGDVTLGSRLAETLPRHATPPAMRVLGPVERPELHYPDGLEVRSTSTVARLHAGQRAGLAMTWTARDLAGIAPAGVAWDVALYDSGGQQVTRRSGVRHRMTAIAPGQPITSWFVLDTDPGASPGKYEFRVRPLDQFGQLLPIAAPLSTTTTEWLAGYFSRGCQPDAALTGLDEDLHANAG